LPDIARKFLAFWDIEITSNTSNIDGDIDSTTLQDIGNEICSLLEACNHIEPRTYSAGAIPDDVSPPSPKRQWVEVMPSPSLPLLPMELMEPVPLPSSIVSVSMQHVLSKELLFKTLRGVSLEELAAIENAVHLVYKEKKKMEDLAPLSSDPKHSH
jgi:hypothetical protein